MLKPLLILLILLIVLNPLKAFSLGEPLFPSSSEQIIVTLKNKNISPLIGSMKERLKKQPKDEEAAKKIISSYLELSKTTGDERYLGYAMVVINHWSPGIAPEGILLLKARLVQRQHHFSESLDILNRIIEKNPRSGEAYLLAAYIYMAQGEMLAASRACKKARPWLAIQDGLNCISRVQGLSGQGEKAYQILQTILPRSTTVRNSVSPSASDRETYLNLAELAVRLGKTKAAEKYYRLSIASRKTNVPGSAKVTVNPQAVMGLADMLLSQMRYQECVDLLQEELVQRQHPPALRETLIPLAATQLILAKGFLGEASDIERAKLRRYFRLEELRNKNYSSRDFARYLLDVESDAEQAFIVARENWKTQREPDDLLVLLRSANDAKKDKNISDVFQWWDETGLEDVRLEQIVLQLR